MTEPKKKSDLAEHDWGSRVLKLQDEGTDVWELQIRLMGWGVKDDHVKVTGTLDQTTKNALKRFQKAHELPITGKADHETFLQLDREKTDHPIDFDKLECECADLIDRNENLSHLTACEGFGRGQYEGEYRANRPEREAYHKYEWPGIDRSVVWAIRGLMHRAGVKSVTITSGYRCHTHNAIKGRTSTNHMGKAVDIKVNLTGYRHNGSFGGHEECDLCKWTRDVGKACGFQIGWSDEDRISMEHGSGASFNAYTWVHLDSRRIHENRREHVESLEDLDGPTYDGSLAGAWSFPVVVDPEAGMTVSPPVDPGRTSVAYFHNTERSEFGGTYPVGKSRLFHSGVHLYPVDPEAEAEGDGENDDPAADLTPPSNCRVRGADDDDGAEEAEAPIPVHAAAKGTLVAARMTGEYEHDWGSRNFVLLKHKVGEEEKEVWSLYMHLRPELLVKDGQISVATSDAPLWLQKLFATTWKVKANNGNGTDIDKLPFFLGWDDEARRVRAKVDDEEAWLSSGDTVTCLQQYEVDDDTLILRCLDPREDKEGFVYVVARSAGDWLEQDESNDPNKQHRDDLKDGKVICPEELEIGASEVIGNVGNFYLGPIPPEDEGAEELPLTPVLHFEVFGKSSENLLEGEQGFNVAEDPEEKIGVGKASVIKIIGSVAPVNGALDVTFPDELQAIYAEEASARVLRKLVCKGFPSPWSVDWAGELTGQSDLAHLPEGDLQSAGELAKELNFWSDASDVLPSSNGRITAYHPITFIEWTRKDEEADEGDEAEAEEQAEEAAAAVAQTAMRTIELQLSQNGRPLGNQKYKAVLPDGSEKEGELENGLLKLEDVEALPTDQIELRIEGYNPVGQPTVTPDQPDGDDEGRTEVTEEAAAEADLDADDDSDLARPDPARDQVEDGRSFEHGPDLEGEEFSLYAIPPWMEAFGYGQNDIPVASIASGDSWTVQSRLLWNGGEYGSIPWNGLTLWGLLREGETEFATAVSDETEQEAEEEETEEESEENEWEPGLYQLTDGTGGLNVREHNLNEVRLSNNRDIGTILSGRTFEVFEVDQGRNIIGKIKWRGRDAWCALKYGDSVFAERTGDPHEPEEEEEPTPAEPTTPDPELKTIVFMNPGGTALRTRAEWGKQLRIEVRTAGIEDGETVTLKLYETDSLGSYAYGWTGDPEELMTEEVEVCSDSAVFIWRADQSLLEEFLCWCGWEDDSYIVCKATYQGEELESPPLRVSELEPIDEAIPEVELSPALFTTEKRQEYLDLYDLENPGQSHLFRFMTGSAVQMSGRKDGKRLWLHGCARSIGGKYYLTGIEWPLRDAMMEIKNPQTLDDYSSFDALESSRSGWWQNGMKQTFCNFNVSFVRTMAYGKESLQWQKWTGERERAWGANAIWRQLILASEEPGEGEEDTRTWVRLTHGVAQEIANLGGYVVVSARNPSGPGHVVFLVEDPDWEGKSYDWRTDEGLENCLNVQCFHVGGGFPKKKSLGGDRPRVWGSLRRARNLSGDARKERLDKVRLYCDKETWDEYQRYKNAGG